MGYKRSGTDPHMHYKWTIAGLIIWLSWIDDCMVWRPKEIMKEDFDKSNKYSDCDDVGEVKEYVGCKIQKEDGGKSFKFTQPVLMKSFADEFDLPGKRSIIQPRPTPSLSK
eukprot:11893730-Ditylum_brightwellii.AAC.1